MAEGGGAGYLGQRLAFSYARVSDPREDGVQVQHEINRRRAAAEGFQIPDEYLFEDIHVSGRSTTRPGLDRMIHLVEEGASPATAAFVRNRERLGRTIDPGWHDYMRIHLQKHGVRLVYSEGSTPDFSQGMTEEAAVQAMYDRMESVGSGKEVTKTRERTRTGVRRRLKKGFWTGGPVPYGTTRWLVCLHTGDILYQVPEGKGARGTDHGYVLKWDTDGSVEAIQLIFSWTLEEGCGPTEIVRRLDKMGLPPAVRPDRKHLRSPYQRKTAKGWTVAGVRSILKRRLYCGQLLWPRSASMEEAVDAEYAALNGDTPILHRRFMENPPIMVQNFEAAQEIIRGRRRRAAPPEGRSRPLLSGIIRCPKCGAPWYGHRGNYYRHDAVGPHSNREGCPFLNRYIRMDDVEPAILDRALTVLQTDWFEDGLVGRLKRRVEQHDAASRQAALDKQRDSVAKAERILKGLLKRQAGAPTEATAKAYEEAIREQDEDVREAQRRLTAMERSAAVQTEAFDRREELLDRGRARLAEFADRC